MRAAVSLVAGANFLVGMWLGREGYDLASAALGCGAVVAAALIVDMVRGRGR